MMDILKMDMMKRVVLTLLGLALTALPTFAADNPPPAPEPGMHDMHDMHGDMRHMRHEHPEMGREMMKNPQHLLAMGYHKNIVAFGKALEKVAHQGPTVPRDFARAAVTEMRRSADQMEIYHEQGMKNLPAELQAKKVEMAKMMTAHLTEMRSELAQLDDLTKGDRIDSAEVLKHLHALLKGCEGMGHGGGACGEGMHRMHGAGEHGDMGCAGEHGDMGCAEEHGCMGCGCGHGKKQGAGMEWCSDTMQGQMMSGRDEMMAEVKAQDAELNRLVDQMNAAPAGQKQALMADILTRIVKQRSAMLEKVEKMRHLHHSHGEEGMPPCMMRHDDQDDDSDPGDLEPDDADADQGGMNMNDMKMQ